MPKKTNAQKKQQKLETQPSKPEPEPEDEDDDMLNESDMLDGELFWQMTVKPNDTECIIEQPAIPDSLVHITHASFGDQVTKGSRTVLCCASSTSDDEIPICVLIEGSQESSPLDLLFGSPAKFTLKGRNPSNVYLTGYIQPEPSGMPDMDDMSDGELEIHEQALRENMKARKRGPFDDDEAGIPEPATKKRKIEAPQAKKEPEAKKPQQPQQQKPQPQKANANKAANATSSVSITTATTTITETNTSDNNNNNNNNKSEATNQDKPLSKRQQRKLLQTQKKNEKTEKDTNENNNKEKDEKDSKKETTGDASNGVNTSTVSSENNNNNSNGKKEEESKPKTTTQTASANDTQKFPNGIEYKDLKEGTGPVIQNGQTLQVYYVGQLQDKSIFDKNISGDGFEFKLGGQDVIKGWNLGLKGMKVGGKRRIVLPPKFAYGSEGSGKEIPPNSQLTFTVEVRNAK